MSKLIRLDYEEHYFVREVYQLIQYIDIHSDSFRDTFANFVNVYSSYMDVSERESEGYKNQLNALLTQIKIADMDAMRDSFIDFKDAYNIYDDFGCYCDLLEQVLIPLDEENYDYVPIYRSISADDSIEEYYCLKI